MDEFEYDEYLEEFNEVYAEWAEQEIIWGEL